MADLLWENRLQMLHPRSIINLLQLLGYKYSNKKEKNWDDQHESHENITFHLISPSKAILNMSWEHTDGFKYLSLSMMTYVKKEKCSVALDTSLKRKK